jgi:quaternary ammonium compound-resistance protein SugE
MAWVFLIIAGLLETGWGAGLKAAAERPVWWLVAATAAMLVASMLTLALAMRTLPLGVAYPIWTGIGSVGAVVLGAVVFKEALTPSTIIGVLFLCVGMVLIGKAH